jgi:hypothetical protein
MPPEAPVTSATRRSGDRVVSVVGGVLPVIGFLLMGWWRDPGVVYAVVI